MTKKKNKKGETKKREPRDVGQVVRERRLREDLRIARSELKTTAEELERAVARQEILDSISDYDPLPVVRRERASRLREATAVVLASDWHVEEKVDPVKASGLNAYNLRVADARIDRFTEGVRWLLEMHRPRFQIRDVVLWLGGDLITGYIHEELEETNELSPVRAVRWLRSRLVRVIETLKRDKKIERIHVPCTYGNHGRTMKRRRIATGAENSFEWLLYVTLADQYAGDPRVLFHAPRTPMIYMRVYDFVLRFIHGDQIGYQGGIGGITIPLNKKIYRWDTGRHADITNYGHFHTYDSGERSVGNGSLIGWAPYPEWIGAPFEPPRQAFYLVDSVRGKCNSTPIWVESRSELRRRQENTEEYVRRAGR